MPIAYIGAGSNIGNRRDNILTAFVMLEEAGIIIQQRSSIIETDPVGGPPQNKFLNAVIKIQTSLNPFELLKTLQQIEKKLGRVRTVKNGPRTIDLDILLYDRLAIQTPVLTIPHPRMLTRDFVMEPLREIDSRNSLN